MKKNILKLAVLSSAVVASSFVGFPAFAEGPVDISIVELVEDGAGYRTWEDITGAMPGGIYSAIPMIKNNGTVSVDVRFCISESATNASGEIITLPANTFGIEINENWILDNDSITDASDPASGNCYKYDSRLNVGEMTEPIFTEVSLNSELGNEYQNATFDLHLDAMAMGDEVPENPDTGANTAVRDFAINSGIMFGVAGILAIVIRFLMRRG